jgi:uncharacterized protein YfaS (alpha-2-macroglobulin family)/tetratricopeptide (TPR) repeat protein
MTKWILLIAAAVMLPLSVITAIAGQPVPASLDKADKLYEDKNYAEAAAMYEQLIEAHPQQATQKLMICHLRLQDFDAAIQTTLKTIDRLKGKPEEAIARQQLGNLYMLVPHWGTRAGGVFHRAKSMQGIRLQSHRHDKKLAIEQLTLARDLYAQWENKTDIKDWHEKRIKNLFDMASATASFGIFENQPWYWHWYWSERDDKLAETAGETDFDENQNYWQYQRKRPIGLLVDDKDQPIFPALAAMWDTKLPDDEKALFLLHEIRQLDTSETKEFANLSLYRQAMLARKRFGMDRMNIYCGMVHENGRQPLKDQVDAINAWELADNQAIVLAGGRMRQVDLPDQWDVLGLLNQVRGNLSDSALFASSLYYQTRQQYTRALNGYQKLMATYPKSQWLSQAKNQISHINNAEAVINVPGMQLPGEKASINVTHRNVKHLWFVARKFNLQGYLEALRQRSFNPKEPDNVYIWSLGSWDQQLIGNDIHGKNMLELVQSFLYEPVTTWDQDIVPGIDHRSAQVTLPTALDANGAYLVMAFTSKPDEKLLASTAQMLEKSSSRATMLISDIAIVEKKTTKGYLYFITDARNGQPLVNARVSIQETWNQWDNKKRKNDYFKVMHELTTDANGIALFNGKKDRGSQLHVMVSMDDRFATSDLGYWNPYNVSRSREHQSIYTLTDRPVYRPGQTVQFKGWLRGFENGQWNNLPGNKITLDIYDPRGNKIKTTTLNTDAFGGLSGQLELTADAALGMYRIQYSSHGQFHHQHGNVSTSGGANFRVEEYKKPEFEVTVKTGESQIKLGQTIKADINARYYFGQPVTQGQVTYKVFRETYINQQFINGPWDWLYGQGYGLSWYESPWFGWWGRCGFIAPDWWYGWYPYWQRSSVRELVTEGTGELNEEGKFTINIDTANTLRQHGDQDHRYFIEAQVRDESRRVIKGSGSVIATRQAFFATLQPARGYYLPNEQIDLQIICHNPDGSPVQTKGQLIISQVQWTGPSNKTMHEVELDRQTVTTDEQGRVTVQYRYANSGQLKFQFIAPDAWGSTVEGYALVWVAGNNFDGKLYRFNDLELITDKRTYEPGQTAHVMINTKQPDSYILLSTDAFNGMLNQWQIVHIPGKSIIIDIPIEQKHRPNFFIEALTVSDAKMHQQMAQICVPPANSILDVTVQTDKPTYQPGETATVNVSTRDLDGKPVMTQIALSAFDQSLLYIAGQTSGNMSAYYHGQLNHHHFNVQTNLQRQFAASGYLNEPANNLSYPLPDDWNGQWGPDISDWRVISGEELDQLGNLRLDGIALGTTMRAPAPMMTMQKGAARLSSGMVMAEASSDAMASTAPTSKLAMDKDESGGGGAVAEDQPVSTRENFADTALWLADLTTDSEGKATATFTVPDNLTTWQIGTWAMSKTTQTGQGDTTATATKNLLVRLQTPRFMVQRDELLLTANVHNYLDHEVTVMVDLNIPADTLVFVDRMATQRQVTLIAGGQATLNWRVRAMNEGMARIAVTAKSKDASDAMALTIPVLIHGSMQQIAQTAIMQRDELDKTLKIELDLPQQIQPQQTELYVSFSPTLIGTMLDALPYLLDYPYGCTEQTVSRFVPAVQVRKTLKDMGLTLADIKKQFPAKVDGKPYHHPWNDSPVFDDAQMDKIIREGLTRILSMQNADGGWGWWKGTDSGVYLTAHVLYALQTAQRSGVDVDANVLNRAANWLSNEVQRKIRDDKWDVSEPMAYAAYVLAVQKQNGPWLDMLYTGRDKLNLYGKALLAMTMHELGKTDEAQTTLRNIMQYRKDNLETQLSWFDLPNGGYWWCWYNSDIETHAWILRAMTAITPKDETAPRLIKWLLNHREHGYYWRSTRDTALCIDAMSSYVTTTGESDANYTLTLELDGGAITKTVKINKDNLLTHDNTFVLKGLALPAGKHTLTVRKQGAGALYLSCKLSFFGMQESIPAYGHELHLKRTYYQLKQIPFTVDVDNAKGEQLAEKRLRYERIELKDGDAVASGDLIQVEMNLNADNDYTYLAIEDFKPAGCEPIDVQSGYVVQEGFGTYRELRDQKTMFFIEHIGQGDHLLRYRLRAEVPGTFHALPARVFAMYVPRLDAGSAELQMKIVE